ncbi:YHS domain-containing protein [Marinobacter sp. NP-4(2019)]|uniref:YHS domain-containing (seleno)protein n=1 Tax=Marinobacter sp. NP-4(2019) TaxID=2488665 RepID=UPI000FC3E918|nr:YHS domain-containing (seleno)protein [Marinobacter sp. NP-4(2019)]AZT84826.1 YHS domain-containing protein [Marinobacter sp. NP-4(2019)]
MIKILILMTISLFSASHALADEDPVYTGLLSNTGAGGYDTVSYFKTGEPTKGSTEYTTEYMGATWRFSTAENLALFEATPERYAPAYGGYCAWAVSQGYLAKGDPQHWAIRDGRLFLNYDESVQNRWLKDTEAFIRQADKNWPQVLE